jgi:RHS repeat-associated protein
MEMQAMRNLCIKAAAFLVLNLVLQPAWSMPPQIAIPPSGNSTLNVQLLPGQTATLLPSGQWLLLGGQGKNGPVSTATLQNPFTGASTTLKTGMLSARAFHSATLLPNGLVLVVGGTGPHGAAAQTAEIFDPSSRVAGALVADLLPRAHHTSTLLTDGTVLIAGGVAANGAPLASVELWNFQTGQSAVLSAGLEDGRRDAIATLLPDGTVILWGGSDAHGNPLSYADLYDPDTKSFSSTTYTIPTTPDLNLPYLTASLPADGASDVSTSPVVGLRFSKALQVATVNPGSITLTGPSGEVSVKVVPAEGGRLAFVTPASSLQSGTLYSLTIDGPLDTQGLLFVHESISFTTKGTPGASSGNSGAQSGSSAASEAAELPPLQAPPGVTALSGQALLVSGQPLANVTISIGSQKTRSDSTGRFLLQHIDDGHQVFVIEGATADSNGNSFGLFEVGTNIQTGITNVLTYKIWMTPLDTAHAIPIPSPTLRDTIVTTPALPGLKLDLPPETVIYDHYGHVVHQLTITPIRLDRPPFPIPQGLNVTFYFTIQPGGSYLRVGGGTYPRGARLIYPNARNVLAGTPFTFWNYDPDQRGWFVYGMGRVSPDRKEVVPDPGVSIYEFTGAMDGGPGGGPPNGSPAGGGGGGGDPVDASTGLFNYEHTDFYLPDLIPINVVRTYRQNDTTSRAFGLGTSISYDIFPVGDQFPYTYMDLILPDGGRIHYYRISSGTSYSNAVFLHTATPTAFYGSTISWDPAVNINGGGWALRFKDGTVWGFPDSYQAATGAQGSIVFVQDRFGNTLNISRNLPGNGNINQITSPNGRWLQFTYDTCNRIQQITDNSGRTTVYGYDSNTCSVGHLQTVKDQNGNTTTFGYEGATIDEMTSITDGRGIEYLQNYYDANNRIYQQKLANGGTYQFAYTTDPYGNVTQTNITDPNGNIEQMNFSTPEIFESGFQTGGYPTSKIFALGQSVQQTFTYNLGTPANNPGSFVQTMTDPLNRTTAYTYDALGNTTSVTQLSGTSTPSTISYTYEPIFNRVATVTDPLNHTTTFTYNDSIDQIVKTDPLGNQWITAQNSLGQTVSAKDPAGDAWQYGYSGADLMSVTDPLNNVTTFVYDGAGRKASTTDPIGEQTTFTYDGLNNLLTSTDPLGEETQYTYDQNNNRTSVTDPKNTANPTQFIYNNMDLVKTRTDALGNSDSYQYDLNNNLTCHTDRKAQITVLGFDGLNRKTSAGYGAASCTSTTFPNSTTFTYDGANRLKTAADSLTGTIQRNYDGLDDLNYENTPQGTINYTFDSARRRSNMTVAGQTEIQYGYDAANHLLQIAQGTSAVNLVYDNVGRRSSLNFPNGITAGYSYDSDSHLAGISYQNGATTLGNLIYGYDSIGRRSQAMGSYAKTDLPAAVSSALYNAANQITTWAGTSVTSDLDANLQSDGTNTYTWDLRNQLSAISGGSTSSFQYDGLRRRISKTINGTATAFLYDGWNVVQELSGTTPTANLITGLNLDEILARTDSAGVRYFLNDALGSVVALTNSSAAIETQYTYDPFGNTTTSGPTSTNAFQYTGRENDGTSLYFYRARYFRPTFGRFCSEDPIGFKGGTNLYGYLADDPINRKDPSGHGACADILNDLLQQCNQLWEPDTPEYKVCVANAIAVYEQCMNFEPPPPPPPPVPPGLAPLGGRKPTPCSYPDILVHPCGAPLYGPTQY